MSQCDNFIIILFLLYDVSNITSLFRRNLALEDPSPLSSVRVRHIRRRTGLTAQYTSSFLPRRGIREHHRLIGLLVQLSKVGRAQTLPPVHRAPLDPLGLYRGGGAVVRLEEQVREKSRHLIESLGVRRWEVARCLEWGAKGRGADGVNSGRGRVR